jgi:hypothetical protein
MRSRDVVSSSRVRKDRWRPSRGSGERISAEAVGLGLIGHNKWSRTRLSKTSDVRPSCETAMAQIRQCEGLRGMIVAASFKMQVSNANDDEKESQDIWESSI